MPDGLAFRAVVELEHPRAADLLAAVKADNTPQVLCSVAGGVLRCEVSVGNLGTLLATVDDLLACLGIAASVLDGAEPLAPPENGWPQDERLDG